MTEEKLEKIYQEVLDKELSTWETIKEFDDYKHTVNKKPKRPILFNQNSLAEVKKYTESLEQYEKDLEVYNRSYEDYKLQNNKIEDLKERYIKEESGLNNIPEKYQSKVYSYAYQRGHYAGYDEVLNYLYDLVEIFE
jgi:glutamate mutase epsilon subunit